MQLGQAISREILDRTLAREAGATTETVCPTCQCEMTAGESERWTVKRRAAEVD